MFKLKNLMLGGLFALSMLTSVFSIASADDGDLLWSHEYHLTYESKESDISCYDSSRNNICPSNIDSWSEYTLCIDVNVVPSSDTTAFYQSPGYWSSFYSDIDTLYTKESTCRTLRPGSVDTEGGSNELPIYWNIRPNCGEGGMGDDCGAVEGIVSYRLYEGVYVPPVGGDDTGDGENSLFGSITKILQNYTGSLANYIPIILIFLISIGAIVVFWRIIRNRTINIFGLYDSRYNKNPVKYDDETWYYNSGTDSYQGLVDEYNSNKEKAYQDFMHFESGAGVSYDTARKWWDQDRREGKSYYDSVESAYYDRKKSY